MNQCYSSVLELSLCCECVISSVLSCHSKILKQRLTSVTAQCYSSVLFGKQRKIHPPGMKAGQHKRNKEKRSLRLNFGSSFYMFFSHSSLRTFLSSIFTGFFLSLSFSYRYFGLLFSYSNYLTKLFLKLATLKNCNCYMAYIFNK